MIDPHLEGERSWKEIGALLGMSDSAARRAFKSGLRKLRKENSAELRVLIELVQLREQQRRRGPSALRAIGRTWPASEWTEL